VSAESGYDGFSVGCGCHCARCGLPVCLEGYYDPCGTHYCGHCDDYVRVVEDRCAERSEERITARALLVED
jgi:hypothetical protein